MISPYRITLDADAGPLTNEQRLESWKIKWRLYTGNKAVDLYTVAFCRTCKKPHWIINALHRHYTAYCKGH